MTVVLVNEYRHAGRRYEVSREWCQQMAATLAPVADDFELVTADPYEDDEHGRQIALAFFKNNRYVGVRVPEVEPSALDLTLYVPKAQYALQMRPCPSCAKLVHPEHSRHQNGECLRKKVAA